MTITKQNSISILQTLRRLILTMLMVFCYSQSAFTQPDTLWSRGYGGNGEDNCVSAIVLEDGFLLVGNTTSFGAGGSDFWAVRTDFEGDTVWTRSYGDEFDEICNSAIKVEDGFVLAGGTNSRGAGDFDIWVILIDNDGELVLERIVGTPGPEICNEVICSSDGGYAMAGSRTYYPAGNYEYEFALLKYDSEWNYDWFHGFGGQREDKCNSVIQTDDGGYLLFGDTQSFGEGESENMWLLKIDGDGDSLWSETYGTAGYQESGNSIIRSETGYILAGEQANPEDQITRTIVYSIDEDRNTIWSRTYGGDHNSVIYRIVNTFDGAYALAGFTDSFGAGEVDFWLTKINSTGGIIWEQTFGTQGDETCSDFVQLPDRSFVLAGKSNAVFENNLDAFWLIRTETDPQAIAVESVLPSDPVVISPSPNPFNSTTIISYSLPVASQVSLKVFDLSGREVKSLVQGYVEAGRHSISFSGEGMVSGVYLVKMDAGKKEQVRKVLLVR